MSGASRRPNVIVCLCDQLRAFEVGCYGNEVIRTPNIDRLAAEGVRFEVACPNNPVCTPSRSTLLTGQYGRTSTGALGNVADTPPSADRVRLIDPTVAEVLRAAGYDTALIGKWHIHPHPNLVGFDYALFPHHSHRNTTQTYFENDGAGFEVAGFAPYYEIEQVKTYLEEHRDRLFFLFYNISPPHMPLADAPERYTRMYSRDAVPLRENVWVDGELAHDERWFKIYLWDYLFYRRHLPYTERLPAGFNLRDLTALYYGLATCVDDRVGELMTALQDLGLANDTILLFTSDHGDNLGSHHFFNKDRLVEESVRIPMIWRWPAGLAPRGVTTQVASMVDVAPTLLSLAGLPIPDTVQGTDLAPVVRGEAETVGENAAYIETPSDEIGIRTLTHLYGVRMDRNKEQVVTRPIADDRYLFYDLRYDPYELTNLAKTAEQSSLAKNLRNRLLDWHRGTRWLTVRE